MNRFLLEVELFSKMTAHLNVREKYELIVDPGKKANVMRQMTIAN